MRKRIENAIRHAAHGKRSAYGRSHRVDHAFGREEFFVVHADQFVGAVQPRQRSERCEIVLIVQFVADLLNDPQTHDVLLQAELPVYAALVGIIHFKRERGYVRSVSLHAEDRPRAAGNVRRLPFQRRGEHRACRIVRGGQNHLRLIAHDFFHFVRKFPYVRSGLRKRQKQRFFIPEFL